MPDNKNKIENFDLTGDANVLVEILSSFNERLHTLEDFSINDYEKSLNYLRLRLMEAEKENEKLRIIVKNFHKKIKDVNLSAYIKSLEYARVDLTQLLNMIFLFETKSLKPKEYHEKLLLLAKEMVIQNGY